MGSGDGVTDGRVRVAAMAEDAERTFPNRAVDFSPRRGADEHGAGCDATHPRQQLVNSHALEDAGFSGRTGARPPQGHSAAPRVSVYVQRGQVPKISRLWEICEKPCSDAMAEVQRSTAGPSTSTVAPQERQTRWW